MSEPKRDAGALAPLGSGSCPDAALWWVRIVPVVPIAPMLRTEGGDSKPHPQPLIRWREDGPLRTEAEVREYWARNPTAQVAVVLGRTTDGRLLGAVDTDLKNRKDGMPEPPVGFAEKYRHSTKSGGSHDLFLYKVEPPGDINRRSTGVGGFVDVLLDGLLVVPPSKFDGAGEYRVARSGPIPEFEAAGLALDAASPWLREAWKTHRARTKALATGTPDDGEPISEGNRRTILLSRAGKLRDLGVGEAAILADLREFNSRRCRPPLPDGELVALARDMARRYQPTHEPKIVPGTDGPSLFREVVSALKCHYFMEEEWHYSVSALGVLQSYLAPILPAVFYLFYGGGVGSGKTHIGSFMAHLTGGLLLENVSPSALARVLGDPDRPARTLVIDEADVQRGRDLMEVRDALIRQGYTAKAAPYTRWDAGKKEVEQVPIYGMKILTWLLPTDDALTSRGFSIPTASPEGEAGFKYVVEGFDPRVGDLPSRLDAWARSVRETWPPERVHEFIRGPEFPAKVKAAVAEGRFGANRDSELAGTAVIVSEVAGVDVGAELRTASELRRVTVSDVGGGAAEELRDAILAEVGVASAKLDESEPDARVAQKALKDRINRDRKARGERPVDDRTLKLARQALGVKPAWLRTPKNRTTYVLPASFVRQLREAPGEEEGALGKESPPQPNPPNLANPVVLDGGVSHVSHVSHEGEPSPTPSEPPGADPPATGAEARRLAGEGFDQAEREERGTP